MCYVTDVNSSKRQRHAHLLPAQISTTLSCLTVPVSPVKVHANKAHSAGVMSWLREADIPFTFSSGFDF